MTQHQAITQKNSLNKPALAALLGLALLSACGDEGTKKAPTDPPITPAALLVAGSNGDDVMLVDQATGKIEKQFIAKGSGGLSHPDTLIIGPDDSLYIASGTDEATSAILRYDITNGTFLNKFASGGGMNRPYGIAFGPDEKLYVASFQSDQILRYDAKTGAFIDEFAKGNGMPDGLNGPDFLLFGPDDKLYVTTQGSVAVNGMPTYPMGLQSQVLRYDITTKTAEVLVTNITPDPEGGGYVSLLGLAFGPDCTAGLCDLFVSDYAGSIRKYDYNTGMLKQTLSTNYTGKTPAENNVGSIAFGEGGYLFAATFNTNEALGFQGAILRYEGDTGNPAPSEGNTSAIFTPETKDLARPVGIVARPRF